MFFVKREENIKRKSRNRKTLALSETIALRLAWSKLSASNA